MGGNHQYVSVNAPAVKNLQNLLPGTFMRKSIKHIMELVAGVQFGPLFHFRSTLFIAVVV